MGMTFVLSDESVNSHKTWVKTSGIKLERFEKNPVMLWSHNGDFPPIGRWENIRIEGERLLADAVFDESDELAKALKSKVEQGLLKACSIGFYPTKYSSDKADLKAGQMYETIVECELIEASLCAVGSNENAMKLYNEKGEIVELSAADCGLKLLSINQKDNIMTEEEVRAMQSELEELKAYKAAAEQAEAARRQAAIAELVAKAVENKKIRQAEAEVWKKLASLDYESAKIAIEGLQGSGSIAGLVNNGVNAPKPTSEYSGKSWRELDREGKLLELKSIDIEAFKALYKSEFGVDYK